MHLGRVVELPQGPCRTLPFPVLYLTTQIRKSKYKKTAAGRTWVLVIFMLKIDAMIPYAPTKEIGNGYRGEPEPCLEPLLLQLHDVLELRRRSQRELEKESGRSPYCTYKNDGKLHEMILVGVGMKQIAMGRNFSSSQTPFVLLTECLTIWVQY